nr:MAG TPA: hypothetical protein [Caudoviricetes sp.]
MGIVHIGICHPAVRFAVRACSVGVGRSYDVSGRSPSPVHAINTMVGCLTVEIINLICVINIQG